MPSYPKREAEGEFTIVPNHHNNVKPVKATPCAVLHRFLTPKCMKKVRQAQEQARILTKYPQPGSAHHNQLVHPYPPYDDGYGFPSPAPYQSGTTRVFKGRITTTFEGVESAIPTTEYLAYTPEQRQIVHYPPGVVINHGGWTNNTGKIPVPADAPPPPPPLQLNRHDSYPVNVPIDVGSDSGSHHSGGGSQKPKFEHGGSNKSNTGTNKGGEGGSGGSDSGQKKCDHCNSASHPAGDKQGSWVCSGCNQAHRFVKADCRVRLSGATLEVEQETTSS
jgi:hypothetical protein